jgi:hypothetical protein
MIDGAIHNRPIVSSIGAEMLRVLVTHLKRYQLMKCMICGLELNVESDPLSNDCGGDCWGCVGEVEANLGHDPSLVKVRNEFKMELRSTWIEQVKHDEKKR